MFSSLFADMFSSSFADNQILGFVGTIMYSFITTQMNDTNNLLVYSCYNLHLRCITKFMKIYFHKKNIVNLFYIV